MFVGGERRGKQSGRDMPKMGFWDYVNRDGFREIDGKVAGN